MSNWNSIMLEVCLPSDCYGAACMWGWDAACCRCIARMKAVARASVTLDVIQRHTSLISRRPVARSLGLARLRSAIGYLLWFAHKLPGRLTARALRDAVGDSTCREMSRCGDSLMLETYERGSSLSTCMKALILRRAYTV